MAEERELILKLGQKITDRIGHKVTVDDPEYWGLAGVVTDEMAEVALKMKVRKPMTFSQLLKATRKEEKEIRCEAGRLHPPLRGDYYRKPVVSAAAFHAQIHA